MSVRPTPNSVRAGGAGEQRLKYVLQAGRSVRKSTKQDTTNLICDLSRLCTIGAPTRTLEELQAMLCGEEDDGDGASGGGGGGAGGEVDDASGAGGSSGLHGGDGSGDFDSWDILFQNDDIIPEALQPLREDDDDEADCFTFRSNASTSGDDSDGFEVEEGEESDGVVESGASQDQEHTLASSAETSSDGHGRQPAADPSILIDDSDKITGPITTEKQGMLAGSDEVTFNMYKLVDNNEVTSNMYRLLHKFGYAPPTMYTRKQRNAVHLLTKRVKFWMNINSIPFEHPDIKQEIEWYYDNTLKKLRAFDSRTMISIEEVTSIVEYEFRQELGRAKSTKLEDDIRSLRTSRVSVLPLGGVGEPGSSVGQSGPIVWRSLSHIASENKATVNQVISIIKILDKRAKSRYKGNVFLGPTIAAKPEINEEFMLLAYRCTPFKKIVRGKLEIVSKYSEMQRLYNAQILEKRHAPIFLDQRPDHIFFKFDSMLSWTSGGFSEAELQELGSIMYNIPYDGNNVLKYRSKESVKEKKKDVRKLYKKYKENPDNNLSEIEYFQQEIKVTRTRTRDKPINLYKQSKDDAFLTEADSIQLLNICINDQIYATIKTVGTSTLQEVENCLKLIWPDYGLVSSLLQLHTWTQEVTSETESMIPVSPVIDVVSKGRECRTLTTGEILHITLTNSGRVYKTGCIKVQKSDTISSLKLEPAQLKSIQKVNRILFPKVIYASEHCGLLKNPTCVMCRNRQVPTSVDVNDIKHGFTRQACCIECFTIFYGTTNRNSSSNPPSTYLDLPLTTNLKKAWGALDIRKREREPTQAYTLKEYENNRTKNEKCRATVRETQEAAERLAALQKELKESDKQEQAERPRGDVAAAKQRNSARSQAVKKWIDRTKPSNSA